MKVGCSRLDNGRAVHEKSAVLEGQQDINDLQYRGSVQLKLANRSGEQVRIRSCTKLFSAFWRFIAILPGNDVYGPNVPTLTYPQGLTGTTSADENSLVAGIELWR